MVAAPFPGSLVAVYAAPSTLIATLTLVSTVDAGGYYFLAGDGSVALPDLEPFGELALVFTP